MCSDERSTQMLNFITSASLHPRIMSGSSSMRFLWNSKRMVLLSRPEMPENWTAWATAVVNDGETMVITE